MTSSCVACSQKTLLNRLDSRGLDLTRRATGVNGVVYTNGESTLGSFFRKPLSLSLTEYHNIGISAKQTPQWLHFCAQLSKTELYCSV